MTGSPTKCSATSRGYVCLFGVEGLVSSVRKPGVVSSVLGCDLRALVCNSGGAQFQVAGVPPSNRILVCLRLCSQRVSLPAVGLVVSGVMAGWCVAVALGGVSFFSKSVDHVSILDLACMPLNLSVISSYTHANSLFHQILIQLVLDFILPLWTCSSYTQLETLNFQASNPNITIFAYQI